MYSKDDMILWSMIGSMVINIGKLEVLAFSPEYLFKIFKKSSEMGINMFKENYKQRIDILNFLPETVERQKIINLFGDFRILNDLKNQIEKEKELMELKKIKMMTYFCDNYPKKLRDCKVPPFVLYYKGEEIIEEYLLKSISIVGTRKYEAENTHEFTDEIISKMRNELNYNISGLAIGCDSIGHKITLEYGIKNIAILGQGLGNEIYPKENSELSDEILRKGGTVLSEIPPSLNVKSIYLLQRNRLQAYLANELLILESGKKGGTITTLKAAFGEKRKIYVRNIKLNYTMFNIKNISKVTFVSCYSDIDLIKILTTKPSPTLNFECF